MKLLLLLASLCFYQQKTNGNQIGNMLLKSNLQKKNAADTTSPYGKYEDILLQFNTGTRGQDFLYNATLTAKKEKDEKNAQIIASEYIKNITNPFTLENLIFIRKFTIHSNDPGFKYFINDSAKVDSILGKNASNDQIKLIIYKEEIEPKIKDNLLLDDWKKIKKRIIKKYGKPGEDIALRSMVLFYFNKKDWSSFSKCVVPYVDKYASNIAAFELNNFAWAVFENINDSKILYDALSWSKMTLAEGDFPHTLDTYANILYKLGKKTEAIPFEEKALNIAPEPIKYKFKATLEKMKKGEQTWN